MANDIRKISKLGVNNPSVNSNLNVNSNGKLVKRLNLWYVENNLKQLVKYLPF